MDETQKIKTVYEYDSAGSLVKKFLVKDDDRIIEMNEFFYDSNKKLIKKLLKRGIVQSLVEAIHYEHDDKGSEVKRIVKDSDGDVLRVKECEYDANGKLIKKVFRDSNNCVKEAVYYEYDVR